MAEMVCPDWSNASATHRRGAPPALIALPNDFSPMSMRLQHLPMRLPVWSLRLLVSTLRVCCPLGLAGIASSLTAAPDSPWSPVTPEERSTHWKPLETGRAVEALVWRTEIDDKRYPDDRRRTDY
jgi:hypothetical protein